MVGIIARSVGGPYGITAGQAWECEPEISLSQYQRAKTGALFAAATAGGAAACGYDSEPWHLLGERIGEAYQIADDIRDVVSSASDLGKPTGRDQALGRPNAVNRLGVGSAVARLEELVRSRDRGHPGLPGEPMICARIFLLKPDVCCRVNSHGRPPDADDALKGLQGSRHVLVRSLTRPA